MTFLEFVFRKVLGPPVSGNNYRCPHCAHKTPSVTINPPMAGKAVKYRCHRCQTFGDEFDVLKLAGVFNFSDRRAQVAELRAEYDGSPHQGSAPGVDVTKDQTRSHSPRGLGRVDEGLDSQAVAITYGSLTGDEIEQLSAAVALARELLPGDPEGLMRYCFGMVQWVEESDAQHLAECADPGCDAAVCRTARCLPPLTREQIETVLREHKELQGREG